MAPRPLTGARPTRTWVEPSPPRDWPEPDLARTIHFIGDMHFGSSHPVTGSGQGLFLTRAAALKEDLNEGKLVPRSIDRVQVGDFTELGGREPLHDTEAKNWVSGNDGLGAIQGSFRTIMGNHDIPWNGTSSHRNGDTAATVFGYPGQRNWQFDAGPCKVIGVSPFVLDPNDIVTNGPNGSEPNAQGATIVLDDTAVSYLDTQLGNATKDCIVCCHAPLRNTHLGQFTSFDSTQYWVYIYGDDNSYAAVDNPIRSILASHSRAKVWMSGHSHTIFGEQDWIVTEPVTNGTVTRNIVCINASGIIYTGVDKEQSKDELRSLFLTWKPSGSNNIEVRIRDHGSFCWTSIGGTKVHTVAVPT